MDTLLLVDAHAIIHRAFHALPPLSTKSGIPTNAVYGFFSMLYKATTDYNPRYLAVAFDTPKPTFRKQLFKQYQAQRPPIAANLKPQIEIIKLLLDKGSVTRIEKPGFEADDVIGTLAKKFSNEKKQVIILTGDRDMLQLTNSHISILTPQTGLSTVKLYTPADVEKKLGIRPEQIPDYKALAGDASDNYPGVEGIGPKTASRLLQKFSTVEKLYQHLPALTETKIKEKLQPAKKEVLLFKKIATIVTDLDIELPIESTVFQGFNPEIQSVLKEFELYSLLSRIFPFAKQQSAKKNKPEQNQTQQIELFSN